MDHYELLQKIYNCVEHGKVNKESPFPPDMKGLDGADEWTKMALQQGVPPSDILNKSLIPAMEVVGRKFAEKRIFVPQMLISAKAVNTAMVHLKPFFQSGEVSRKGKFIIGTVAGDLHDIGKNLVAMIVEGAGWEVIDLGVDVSSAKFLESLRDNSDAVVGLSALLTTTMPIMKKTVADIKGEFPTARLLIGGAPISDDFRAEIGADGYAPDPQAAVSFLNTLIA